MSPWKVTYKESERTKEPEREEGLEGSLQVKTKRGITFKKMTPIHIYSNVAPPMSRHAESQHTLLCFHVISHVPFVKALEEHWSSFKDETAKRLFSLQSKTAFYISQKYPRIVI